MKTATSVRNFVIARVYLAAIDAYTDPSTVVGTCPMGYEKNCVRTVVSRHRDRLHGVVSNTVMTQKVLAAVIAVMKRVAGDGPHGATALLWAAIKHFDENVSVAPWTQLSTATKRLARKHDALVASQSAAPLAETEVRTAKLADEYDALINSVFVS